MYIQPNSTIYLCQDVPISPSYTDTRWFATREAQQQYFSSKTVLSFSNVSYQRKERNRIKLQVAPNQMLTAMKCNYMWFKNTSYENKYWYAFVQNARYINDNTIEFEYTIDDIQTWCFDWEMGQCFIDRQHSVADHFGDNILPEPVRMGEMKVEEYGLINMSGSVPSEPSRGHVISHTGGGFPSGYSDFSSQADLCTIVAVVDVDGESVHGTIYGNVYSGLSLYAFDTNVAIGDSGINSFLEQYMQKPDAVVSIYTCPKWLVPYGSFTGEHRVSSIARPIEFTVESEIITDGDNKMTFDGYVPLNNKLYTYPYNYLQIDNGEGEAMVLRYEFSNNEDHALNMMLRGTFTEPVQTTISPINYKNTDGLVLTEQLSLASYPQCSWNTDSFKAWIAQNSIPMAINIGTSAVNIGLASASPTTALGSAVSNSDVTKTILTTNLVNKVGDIATQFYVNSIKADQIRGNIRSNNVNVAHGDGSGFRTGRVCLNYDDAKKIDNFFTMFGYSQQRIAIPNTHARTRYTYIKTVGCELHGAIPSSANENICSIFDNGIRWWADDDVGDYWIRGNDPI